MEITKVFADNLRREREAAGLSGEALGALCKVTGKHIYDIEKGRKKASIGLMQTVSEALDVDLSDLFKVEISRAKVEPISKTILKILAIPDDVYDLAQQVPLNDEIWDAVRVSLNVGIKHNKTVQSKSEKKA
jgi:transcriptional regulator with XRE-family HTH domain